MVKKRMLKLFLCVFAIGLTAGLANADITSDLVGHWKIDDGTGTTLTDSSANAIDAELQGSGTWIAGLVGPGAMHFGGGSAVTAASSVYNNSNLLQDGKLTLAWWGKIDALSADKTYFGLYADGSNRIYFRLRNTSGSIRIYSTIVGAGLGSNTGNVITDTQWHHIGFVIDGATYKVYIDGVLVQTLTNRSLAGLLGDPHVCLATRYTDGTWPFPGCLDDVRIYNRLLTDSEMLDLVGLAQYPPTVDAGPMMSELWPGSAVTLQMDAAASDDGVPNPLTYSWSQISGDTVSFSATDIEDPEVTFPAIGVYELQFSASDGDKTANDTVVIRIRSSNDPMAHWNMDEASGLTALDSANNNDGTLTGDVVPSRVTGWVGSGALEFFGVEKDTTSSYVDVTTDVALDPNMDLLEYEVTLAAWFKINDLANAYHPAIIANSNTGWRLYVETPANDLYGKVTFTPGDSLSGSRAYSTRSMDDGYWHHAVGIYDGSKSYLYVDGLLDTVVDNAGLLDTTDGVPVSIGSRNRKDDFTIERSWSGMIDDTYVYDYAIDASQVAALAAMGNLVPQVDAGEDQTFYMQYGSLQLDGTVIDDGNPVAATLAWTQTDGPGTAAFSDAGIEDPIVTFSEVGVYVLTLTADDGSAISDSVTIAVEDPTCQDVIDDGLLKAADISGPEGVPDCYVDIYDFAMLAGEWLGCNNPQDPECVLLY